MKKEYDYKHNYWIFVFIPTILASAFPDVPFAISKFVINSTTIPVSPKFLHDLFDNFPNAFVFIPLVIGTTYVLKKLTKTQAPKKWIWFVTCISIASMFIHIYIMDPLGF